MWAITAASTLLILVHMFYKDLAIDNVTLALFAFAVAPWILPYIRSLKLPDGTEIVLRGLRKSVTELRTEITRTSEVAEQTQTALMTGIGKRPIPTVAAEPTSDDPNKGKFGGSAERNGRRLSATIEPAVGSSEMFTVDLRVQSTSQTSALPEGTAVRFHLHPTFTPVIVDVSVMNGVAAIRRLAWGAFTVGATFRDDETRLELDLSTLASAPPLFRSR